MSPAPPRGRDPRSCREPRLAAAARTRPRASGGCACRSTASTPPRELLRDAGAPLRHAASAPTTPEPALVARVRARGRARRAARAARTARPRVPSLGAWLAGGTLGRAGAARACTALVPVGHPTCERRLTRPTPTCSTRRVVGLDVFVIPYGPIRSGVFESIQFLIETGGEDVPRTPDAAVLQAPRHRAALRGAAIPTTRSSVAERVAGIAGVAHAIAFSQAVERALGVEPPPARAALAGRPRRARADRVPPRRDRQAGRDDRALRRSGALRDPQGAGHAPARAALTAAASAAASSCPAACAAEPLLEPASCARELDALRARPGARPAAVARRPRRSPTG